MSHDNFLLSQDVENEPNFKFKRKNILLFSLNSRERQKYNFYKQLVINTINYFDKN